MKKTLIFVLMLTVAMLLNGGFSFASEEKQIDQDIQLLRKDLRSQKKQIIAANMELTDAEAEKFWPVYDQYTAETTKIYDTRFALIKEYAENYPKMTDAEAQSLLERWLGTDESFVQVRMKYIPLFEKVLPGKKAARFFQIDKRLGLLLDIQLISQIPLIVP
ncbi:MAG TPA: hypothetical protein VFG09_00365 [Thermodesulfovibrionales bacterium]|nr:hypothetical protein [Thermodesulfovibrionales bacterium]